MTPSFTFKKLLFINFNLFSQEFYEIKILHDSCVRLFSNKFFKKDAEIMNTGQTLLSIGALFLLTLTVLRVNNSILVTDSVMQESKFGILATSLATSLIEKASKKAFDANTFDDAVSTLSELTPSSGLGPGSGEVAPDLCNDFDDFNGYVDSVTNLPSAKFYLAAKVCYVNPNNPDGKITTQSWHKKMTVTVTSSNLNNKNERDTLRLSTIYSYWHFR
jgi:hypothetical protein